MISAVTCEKGKRFQVSCGTHYAERANDDEEAGVRRRQDGGVKNKKKKKKPKPKYYVQSKTRAKSSADPI